MTTPQDPLARLVQAILAYDRKIMDAEAVPTGDDYNELVSMVQEYAPLPISAPQEEPRAPTVYECPDCDWTGTLDQMTRLSEMNRIDERVEAGELVPAGCCPECERLLPVEDCDVPHHTLYDVGLIMRARGWTVTAPAGCPSLDATKGA